MIGYPPCLGKGRLPPGLGVDEGGASRESPRVKSPKTPLELEELIASIAGAPKPTRRPLRLPRGLLFGLGAILALLIVLALTVPVALLGILTDPLRAIDLVIEALAQSLRTLVR